eukprot:RCo028473
MEEIFDDLLSRFLLNLPEEEVTSPERLYFHLEEAYWFYCDFFYESDTTLPQLSLKSFAGELFARAPWLLPRGKSADELYLWFMSYKSSVPVCGVIVFNEDFSKVLMIQHWNSEQWSFPRGKIANEESKLQCALRELWEETGFDASGFVSVQKAIVVRETYHEVTMFIASGVPEKSLFQPQTRKEVRAVAWHHISALPHLGSSSTSAVHFTRVKQILKALSQRMEDLRGSRQRQDTTTVLPTFDTNIVAALQARGLQSAQIAAAILPVAHLGEATLPESPRWRTVPASDQRGPIGSDTEASNTPPSSPGLSASSREGFKAHPGPASLSTSEGRVPLGKRAQISEVEWCSPFPRFTLDVPELLSCFD